MSNEPKFKVGDIVEVINRHQAYKNYGDGELPLETRLKVVGLDPKSPYYDPIVEKERPDSRPFPICSGSVQLVSKAEPKKPLTLFELKEGKKYRCLNTDMAGKTYFIEDAILKLTDGPSRKYTADCLLSSYAKGFEEIMFEPKPLKLASLSHTVVKNEDGSVSAGCQRITKEDVALLVKYLTEEQ